MEFSVVIIKPDGVCKKNIGDILNRLESQNFKIKAVKMLKFTEEKATQFYSAHSQKPFFPGLVKFMVSAPCVVLVVEGENAINRIRQMIGARVPKEAEKGTIRGDLGSDGRRNIVHASDSKESAEKEMRCLFKPEEVFSYEYSDWLNSESG